MKRVSCVPLDLTTCDGGTEMSSGRAGESGDALEAH